MLGQVVAVGKDGVAGHAQRAEPAGADRREAFHRDLLADEPGPDPLPADLAALCFLLWMGRVVGFVLRGIDPRGRLRPGTTLRRGGGALAALVAWAVLLGTVHG